MGDLQCEIRSRPTPQGVELSGLIWSSSKLSGSYVFAAERQGVSGSAQTVQRGLFDLDANQTQILSTIDVRVTGGDQYFAKLTVTAAELMTSCDAAVT